MVHVAHGILVQIAYPPMPLIKANADVSIKTSKVLILV